MAARGSFKTTSKPNKQMEAFIKKVQKNYAVKIGILSDQGQQQKKGADAGLTLAEVATFHEFGTETIPERSFLRATMEEKKNEIRQAAKNVLEKALKHEIPLEMALGIMGQFIQAEIQKRIRAGIGPDLAPSTIARKGSSTPLIDTGQLIQSIRYEVVENMKKGGR